MAQLLHNTAQADQETPGGTQSWWEILSGCEGRDARQVLSSSLVLNSTLPKQALPLSLWWFYLGLLKDLLLAHNFMSRILFHTWTSALSRVANSQWSLVLDTEPGTVDNDSNLCSHCLHARKWLMLSGIRWIIRDQSFNALGGRSHMKPSVNWWHLATVPISLFPSSDNVLSLSLCIWFSFLVFFFCHLVKNICKKLKVLKHPPENPSNDVLLWMT
jgi:hypothetical protein